MGRLRLQSRHRLLCGDSTKPADVTRLMDGEAADLCFCSPPYGHQRDYTEESREVCSDWDRMMNGVFEAIDLVMAEDGQVLVNLGMIHRDGEWIPYWDGWIAWMRSRGWRRFAWYVWDQGPGLPGNWSGRLAPAHEFIWHFCRTPKQPVKARECAHAGEIKKAKGGGQRRKDGTVGDRSGGDLPVQSHAIHDSVFRVNRQGAAHDAGGHPAPYPVGLPALAMQSWPGLVYEPFCGSGTTMVAAEQTGNRCCAMEISPAYCDIVLARMRALTGEEAIRWEG